jgi:diadenosine tetraphosphate (Ap4A) HIT family hydrolase
METTFTLHPRLVADTALIADWPLCRVLLTNDKRFAWIVLVPRQTGLTELFDLDEASRTILMNEIARAATKLKSWAMAHGGCDKINIGIIGNIVPQLHIHVVARTKSDAAWPAPVWGSGQSLPYAVGEFSSLAAEFRDSL